MPRRHFLESLERETDYYTEYKKLETLCERVYYDGGKRVSLNSCIERNFLSWKKRVNYCSFDEIRDHLGFRLDGPPKEVDMNKYFLFSEMMLNLVLALSDRIPEALNEITEGLINTIRATCAKAGFEISYIEGEFMIVEQNSVASYVADNVPNLADAIVEYNHYLLRGDLARKKELLKRIADELEPKRKSLKQCCNSMCEDYFYMVNTMNVRHNNCDKSDKAKYNELFAKLSDSDKEIWYDLIYEQALALFVMLDQRERSRKITDFREQENNKK